MSTKFKWFAWRPVTLDDHRIVWLRWVDRYWGKWINTIEEPVSLMTHTETREGWFYTAREEN